jgi:hypothetical protein
MSARFRGAKEILYSEERKSIGNHERRTGQLKNREREK